MLGTRHEEYSKFENNLPFSFSKGINITSSTYSHEANWHDNPEIQLCTSGNGTVMLDEKTIPFFKNDVIVVNSNVLHHTNTNNNLTYHCLIIDTNFCRQMDMDPLYLEFESKPENPKISNIISKISDMYDKSDDMCRTAKLCSLVIDLLIELREHHTVSLNKNTIKKRNFEAIKSTIKYIRANYHRKLSLDELSHNAAMDKYSLAREFKKLTGKTPVQYINIYRCKKAAEQIGDGSTVSDAARMCGFTNMSFFTKTFRKYLGKYPSDCK